MSKIAIPAVIAHIDPHDTVRLEDLYRRFGNARRRAYSMKQDGIMKSEIERILQKETGLNSRYIKDAYKSIEGLPPHVTFGGKRNQKLRMEGKISKEEYTKRRNSLIISRGDRTKNGNLNARIVQQDGKIMLRINVPPKDGFSERWIYPEIFIPEKFLKRYEHLLDGKHPYTIVLKRRDDGQGQDVRIIVEATDEPKPEPKRVMALDINAGHIDFAVAEKKRVLAVGKINCHEIQHSSTNKTNNMLHAAVNKIEKIARHYNAEVIYGRLNTAKFKGNHGANRKVKRIPHHKLGQTLEHKCRAKRRSEAYTTKVGEKISPLAGLDVHKCSAAAFALKVLDYETFKSLRSSPDEIPRGVAPNEDGGSPRCRLSAGSGPTAPHQVGDLVRNEVLTDGGYSKIPGIRGLPFLESMKTNLPCLREKIC